MKGIKEVLMYCVSYSLITGNELIAAPNAISKISSNIGTTAATVAQVVRVSSDSFRRLGVYSGLMPVNFPQTSQRSYSTYKGSGVGTLNPMQSNIPGNNIADMIRQTELLLRTLKEQTQALNKGDVPAAAQGVPTQAGFQPAIITPLNSFVSQAEKAVVPQVTKVSNQVQATHEIQDQDQASSTIIQQKREELVDRLMACAKVANKTTQEDILAIIDLYSALSPFSKKYITMILQGKIGTDKSTVYSKVIAYVRSQGSTLDVLRNIYARLSEAFGEEAGSVLYRTSQTMQKKKHLKNKDMMNVIIHIVETANAMYPIQAHEVRAIIDIYANLTSSSKK
jgi:hypothetical protein